MDSWNNSNSRNLAKAYVALALAKDVTKDYVNEQSSHEVLAPLLAILDMSSKLLEEVLENVMPEESLTEGAASNASDLVM
jgi:hypothetical protein